jgi:hypothetical protein
MHICIISHLGHTLHGCVRIHTCDVYRCDLYGNGDYGLYTPTMSVQRHATACNRRSCLLCGTDDSAITFRTRQVSYMLETLVTHIQETPFAWKFVHDQLKSCARHMNVDICAPCMQWLQRAIKYADCKTGRYMLLVDQLFMCVLHPGRAPGKTACIQARVYTRVLRTLRRPGNPLILLCPLVARNVVAHTLQPAHKKPLLHIIQCWWEMSGSPELLPSAEVARAVRFHV